MDKKKISILIVSITVITVLFMILSSNFSNGLYTEDDKTLILNNKNNSKVKMDLNANNYKNINNGFTQDANNDKKMIKSDSINAQNDKDIDNKQDSEGLNYQDESKSDNSIDKSNGSKEYDSSSYNTEAVNKTGDKNNMSLFKVSKEKIASELSFSDKVKILSISKNLSPSDLNKLEDDINNDNEKKGISDAIQLLKTRLDNKDFNNIKDIASRFINLDSIN